MRIVSLTAENFKILRAVQINPDGNMVTIGGNNGQGKSSILDAIWVALAGRSVAPPKPIRTGEEVCTISLDMGDIIVTRTFTAKEGGTYTDKVKVADPSGKVWPRPQSVLDDLLGEIGFDPFEFVQMKPDQQAEMLMRLVPLPVDIEEMAEFDEEDYATRRDVNREVERLEAQIAGIPSRQLPSVLPDRRSLVEKLSNAAELNGKVYEERDRQARVRENVTSLEEEIQRLRRSLEEAESRLESAQDEVANFDDVPPLIDTEDLRKQIDEAEELERTAEEQQRREDLVKQLEVRRARSKELTTQMANRNKEREAALAAAKMPIAGLGFQIEGKKPIVTFDGQPFEQVSRSQQIRVSAAIAMAANPQLRILRISDGSLLDEDALKMLAQMADAEDFQLWIERVGDGGVGFILENGELKETKNVKTA